MKKEKERRKKEEEEVNNLWKMDGEHTVEVEYKMADIIGPDFVYEEDKEIVEEEEEEAKDEGIVERVVRQQGHCHQSGGQME